jgi:hypothetical protein
LRTVLQRAAQQAHFLLQQQHLQQIADGLGVADDAVANRLAAQALAQALAVSKMASSLRVWSP